MANKNSHNHGMNSHNLFILLSTYVIALAILSFGDMQPFVVALMPCLAFVLSLLIRR
jgi:hypothetical protein